MGPREREVWMKIIASLMVCSGLLGLLAPGPARGDGERPRARALWAVEAPQIDGRLDDAAWSAAPAFDGFVEREPRLRQRPTVDTTFRVVFDLHNLYVGVHCADDRPDEVQGRIRTRDTFEMFHDDVISLKLDPARDRRTTFGFSLGAGGSRMDYQGIDEVEFRVEFDTIWEGAVARTADGWSAEFRVPWESLGVDRHAPPPVMGLNLTRDHARREATYDWSLIPPPFKPTASSQYGTLVGFEELPRRLTEAGEGTFDYALVPYGLVGFSREPPGERRRIKTEPVYNAGLDASAQFGAGWRGQLTVNTDFAQVDLDDQVVNLTRYGLFLPEKRDFFLKDQDLFRFGLPQEAQLLHTRRIGLRGSGAVPIMGGLKTVGQASDWMRLGLIEVVTRPKAGEPWESHLVARGRAEVGGGSNVGLMMTHRQSLEGAADRNMVLGVDGAFRGTGVPLLVESFGLMSITGADAGAPERATGGAGTGSVTGTPTDRPVAGGGVQATWRGELFRPSLAYTYLHPKLRADLGYFRRVGIHRWGAELEVEPRIGRLGLEKLTLEARGDVVASALDATEILDWGAEGAATLDWDSGFEAGAVVDYRFEVVEEDFTVGRRTTIPAGTYEMLRVNLWATTPGHLPVSGEVGFTGRDFYDGRLLGVAAYLSARPSRLVRMSVGAGYDDVRFADRRRDFASVVVNSKVSFGFTPDLGLDLFVGWNRLEELLLGHARLRWTWAPGSDVFLVYQAEADDDFAAERYQSLLLKATWRWP
jgi:hypothetical protein